MADSTKKFAQKIQDTANESLINGLKSCDKNFDSVQQMIEDSNVEKGTKKNLKRMARNAYS